MQRLDGNALAGSLVACFGDEMTTVRGSCAHCGASARVAELRVYTRAPGKIARCPICGDVVFVLIERGDAVYADFRGFQLPPGTHLPGHSAGVPAH